MCFTPCLDVHVAQWWLLVLLKLPPVHLTEEAENTQLSDVLWWRLVGGAAWH